VDEKFPKGDKMSKLQDDIVQTFNQGMSIVETAEKYGMSYEVIYCIITKAIGNAAVKERKRDRNRSVIQDFTDGMSRSSLCDKYDLCWVTISNILKATMSKWSIKRNELLNRNLQIMQDYQHISRQELMNKYNLSWTRLHEIISKAGGTVKHKQYSLQLSLNLGFKILKKLLLNKDSQSISEELGCSVQYVSCIRKLGRENGLIS
jgi:Mor family transcriptional regulator